MHSSCPRCRLPVLRLTRPVYALSPGHALGIYIFAIWEMFHPLRKGAELWFPDASTLFARRELANFLIEHDIDEMLFTPSFYDTFLTALYHDKAMALPLSRVVLNGEVVSDDLITASLAKLPKAALWNLYSICETHDVCMSHLTEPAGGAPASVGIPMEHLRAIILDEADKPCPTGTAGQLHFDGSGCWAAVISTDPKKPVYGFVN
jgi:non-ribosomal peptide synthetase component F